MPDFPSLQASIGEVISERPFVRLLTCPRYAEYELVPGMVVGRWEALAQVNDMLAVVELKVTESGTEHHVSAQIS